MIGSWAGGKGRKKGKRGNWEEEEDYAELHFSKLFQLGSQHLPFSSHAVDEKALPAAGMVTCCRECVQG